MTLPSPARLAGAILAAALTTAAAPGAAAQEQPRILAIVTTAEPQTQGMAFVLLNAMRQQGRTVEVMLCGPAGDLARRAPPAAAVETVLRPLNTTPQQMFEALVRAGVRAEVCALYLPNAGIGPEALIEGVSPAQPPEMARRMTAPGTTVLPF